MKKILFTVALVATTLVNAQSNKFDQIINQVQNTKGITTISINKGMFKMLSHLKIDSEVDQYKDLIKNVNSIKMIVIESESENKVQTKMVDLIKEMKLEELMTINNEGNNVKFYTENSEAKVFKNLLLDISTGTESVFMILDGEIKAEDINKTIQLASK